MTLTASAPRARTQTADRVVSGNCVASSIDRDAIKRWAKHAYPKAIRSQYGEMFWGRGGRTTTMSSKWGWKHWNNGGVHIVGGLAVVEDYLGREVANVPLAAVAVQIVALMRPPGWDDWEVCDGIDLLVYADFLEESGERLWLSRIRRWAAEAMLAPVGSEK